MLWYKKYVYCYSKTLNAFKSFSTKLYRRPNRLPVPVKALIVLSYEKTHNIWCFLSQKGFSTLDEFLNCSQIKSNCLYRLYLRIRHNGEDANADCLFWYYCTFYWLINEIKWFDKEESIYRQTEAKQTEIGNLCTGTIFVLLMSTTITEVVPIFCKTPFINTYIMVMEVNTKN